MARLGLTINDYRELVKSKYIANSLSDFISRSEFSLDSSALNFIQATNQQRSLSFFKLDINEISEKEIISDSDILNYYQQNQFKFIEPKKVAINFILLNENNYRDSLEVSNQEITDERNLLEEGDENSQTRVSHIQLSFSSEVERNEKLNIAKEIIQKLSDSISFKSLVEEYSDDFGSSSNGGDLGYTDGSILPEKFEIEIENLSVNDISQVIEMPNSIHILKVTEKNEFLFSDNEIKEMILANKSQEILDKTLLNIEDNYLGLKLDDLKSDLNLKIQKSNQFSKDNVPLEFLSFDVSDEMFDQNEVSSEFFGPYEDESGNFLLFEVRELLQETLLSQSAAQPVITKILQLEQAQDTILQELEKYESKANDNKLSDFNSYSLIKRDSSLLPDNLLTDLFTVDLENPVFISSQENGDIYIVRLTKIKNSKNLAKKEDIESAKSSLKSLNSRSYLDTFFSELESNSYIN
jgi:parvulin-like peptidyl-prolyl isomerase